MKEKLNEKEKKYLKGVSKALYIITSIGHVCLMVAIPFIVLSMLIILALFNKFDYHDNTLYYNNDKFVTIEESIEGLTLHYGENTSDIFKYNSEDQMALFRAKDFLEKNSMNMIVIYLELMLLTTLALAIMFIMILKKVKTIFKNINEGNTPFTEENTTYLKEIVKLSIIQLIVSAVMSIILGMFVDIDADKLFNVVNICDLLVTVVIYYIFRYGTLLQSKSKMTIYEE